MNASLRYEIKARAFQIMTGLMAPGKDEPPTYSTPYAERAAAWDKWHNENRAIIDAYAVALDEH